VRDGGALDAAAMEAGGDAAAEGAPGTLDFAIGVTGGGFSRITGVVPLADSGVVVVGGFREVGRFAPDKTLTARGGLDGFVARYRLNQTLAWVAQIGGPEDDVISDVATLPGGEMAITGWFAGTAVFRPATANTLEIAVTSAGLDDCFLAQLASDGSVRWARRAGGSAHADISRGIATSASGRLAITGAVGPSAVFGPGEARQTVVPPGDGPIFVAMYQADGQLDWVRFSIGGPGQGYGIAMIGLEDSPVITGYFNGMAVFGAGADGAGGRALAQSDGRAFLARYASNGALAWVKQMAGSEGEALSASATPQGQIAAVGTFEGSAEFGAGEPARTELRGEVRGEVGAFVARFEPTGQLIWARRVAARGVRASSVRLLQDGALLIGGIFAGSPIIGPDGPEPITVSSMGNLDVLFTRFSQGGDLRWTAQVGGLGDDEGGAMAQTPDGALWGTGRYIGPARFGDGEPRATTLGSGTDGSGFAARFLAPPP
jgi:hypothetical protein